MNLSSAHDWDALLADALPHLQALLDTQRSPTGHPVTGDDRALRERPAAPLPGTGDPLPEVLSGLRALLSTGGYLNGAHPQYFGYFHPRPLPVAVLGDAVAALLNQSPAAWRMGPAATALEHETLGWLAELVGYPVAGGPPGVFTSGGSTANLLALKLARDTALGRATQDTGITGSARLAFYVSADNHYSLPRALDVLGLGRDALRPVPVDAGGRVSVPALRARIAGDRAAGYTPACVIGLACATSTGAVDPLAELADLAAEQGLWFHVDGAAGVPFAAVPDTAAAFTGLDRADSVTVDPHKWLFTPYGLGCLLVRDSGELARSFRGGDRYWRAGDDPDPVLLTTEGARPWKSLGLWLAVRALGREGYTALLARNLRVARYLAERVRARPDLELLREPTLPVVCFRVLASDGHNERLCQALTDSGQFLLTTCQAEGRTWLRVAVNNTTTGTEHIDALLAALA
ncbi:L-2,4-diaminobutyrate decarboxylase [Crossiella equi]|uniref:L-2,4-diaminobutyrate decarboxylase n=1 Tax=Crossiella equi TaxID=130796 RepID=A0ABS5AA43_9PSEU|nr:aspartate aminotransferase family protein [Crossiella equi]MBP2473463.1 L-2,4-diaminobutyrate decarboxylase [Crossiella equi]